MKNFPLFLNTVDETIIVVGGGEAAAQKCRLVSRSQARLRIMAVKLNDELAALVSSNRAEHIKAALDPGELHARLVIIATECAAFDAAAADLAREAGALVNVVDRPLLCDVNMPAIVDRDPVIVAIGTEGAAPVLARRIKSSLETMLEPGLGELAALAGRLRPEVAHRVAPRDRRAFWEWFFGPIRQTARELGLAESQAAVDQVLDTGQIPNRSTGRITLIEVPVRDPDLIPLRAVARLQSADHLATDDLTPKDILELARRDAERSGFDHATTAKASNALEAGQSFVIAATTKEGLAKLRNELETKGLLVEYIQHAERDTLDRALKLVG
ncbi:MAG: NAD(P)-dependent oxidoreductase [Pseudomonadota bacterium]